jgi:membrane-associated HD superfamily phosphohydrolase
MEYKFCTYCNLKKDNKLFDRSKRSIDGYGVICKECRKIIKEKSKNKKNRPNDIFEKKCKKCDIIKPIYNFGIKKVMHDGYRNECNECRSEEEKKRYINISKDKDLMTKRREVSKLYMRKKRNILSNDLNYKEKNKVKNKIYYDKIKNNPEFKLKKSWRQILRRYLKRNGLLKKNKTYAELNYTSKQLKDRLECQFKEGMSWDNYGQWHIDHKKPLSLFPLNVPPSVVNSLCNLQPLWKIDNLRKGKNFN